MIEFRLGKQEIQANVLLVCVFETDALKSKLLVTVLVEHDAVVGSTRKNSLSHHLQVCCPFVRHQSEQEHCRCVCPALARKQ